MTGQVVPSVPHTLRSSFPDAAPAVALSEPPLPFNRPYATGREFEYIQQAIEGGHLSGNGPFSHRCERWLEGRTGSRRALLTTSCTAALEMSALLAGLAPGDEVLMPSYTFVSSASAMARCGAVPVFVDIRPDTLNLDERGLEAALTPRTRAIVPVHYAGVGCDMGAIMAFAERHGLLVIEDAAQAVMSASGGRPLGGIGDLGCLSFHETKNVICGEGGALLVNRDDLVDRAEILLEKGTNRASFLRGQVDKYTWVDLGSSFLGSEINAAFLWAQLEQADRITARRLELWDAYHESFRALETRGMVRRPVVPERARHNAHMYYLLLPDRARRDRLLDGLAQRDINAVFHYVPLHSSPAGRRLGRAAGTLPVTTDIADRLVRLPLWVGMNEGHIQRVAAAVTAVLTDL
jgi:dTDP-4-amino-4,6-dideoxygalactose transaminase